jgi:hypothetical protein
LHGFRLDLEPRFHAVEKVDQVGVGSALNPLLA